MTVEKILISIQPQWVEKILNGEKTIEIRKTNGGIRMAQQLKTVKRKTKANKLFENLESRNIGLSKDPQIAEQQRKAYYAALKEFGSYMAQLARQGKLFTMHKIDSDEYMRCVNVEKE